MYACALRGDGPDTRVPGPFASLRSEQGASPLAPLRGYPPPTGGTEYCSNDRFAFIAERSFFVSNIKIIKEVDHNEENTRGIAKGTGRGQYQIEQYQHRIQRLENRLRYYTEGERKKRNHRLITRGADVESVAPEVRGMSQSAFRILVEQIFSLPEVVALVSSTVDQQEGD